MIVGLLFIKGRGVLVYFPPFFFLPLFLFPYFPSLTRILGHQAILSPHSHPLIHSHPHFRPRKTHFFGGTPPPPTTLTPSYCRFFCHLSHFIPLTLTFTYHFYFNALIYRFLRLLFLYYYSYTYHSLIYYLSYSTLLLFFSLNDPFF